MIHERNERFHKQAIFRSFSLNKRKNYYEFLNVN